MSGTTATRSYEKLGRTVGHLLGRSRRAGKSSRLFPRSASAVYDRTETSPAINTPLGQAFSVTVTPKYSD